MPRMQARERIVLAIDQSSRDDIRATVDELRDLVGVFKIGLQAFIANGPSLVRELVAGGAKIFLDLKIHDIPNTAMHAVAEASSLGASILTVHAGGGLAMMTACVAGVAESQPKPLLLGVTVLTSLDAVELERIGLPADPLQNAVRLARLAREAKLGGVVASPLEIAAIREACGNDFVILTPGIRGAGDASGDQRRTMSAADAVAAGADYIVVGRPITAARDRRAAALAIAEQIETKNASR
jgi:orotidine-5'-phosphate decarboxylase